METIFEKIWEIGILPVVCPPNVDSSEPLADALCRGGLPVIEITLRAPWAMESIRRIHAAFPGMLIGAGTVFTTSQVDDAVTAGASFIVSPGLDESLVRYCQQRDIPIVPGCATPSEITRGINLGLKTLKFFPAEINGGAAALKLYHGPFPDCTFIPTGGLNMNNITPYLDLPYVAACGGSFIAPKADLAAENYDAIAGLCKKCIDIALDIKPLENAQNPASAAQTNDSRKNVFTTRSVPRALAWYRRQGIAISENSIKRDKTNTPCTFVLPDSVNGSDIEITTK